MKDGKIVPFRKREYMEHSDPPIVFTVPLEDKDFWLLLLSFALIGQGSVFQGLHNNGKVAKDDHYRATMVSLFLYTLSHVHDSFEDARSALSLSIAADEVMTLMMALTHFAQAGKILLVGDFVAKQYEKKCNQYIRIIDKAANYYRKEAHFYELFHAQVREVLGAGQSVRI